MLGYFGIHNDPAAGSVKKKLRERNERRKNREEQ